jgi:hypothetical protein
MSASTAGATEVRSVPLSLSQSQASEIGWGHSFKSQAMVQDVPLTTNTTSLGEQSYLGVESF